MSGQRIGSDLGPGVTALRAQLGGRVCHQVADEETAARIISRLSDKDFWTAAGIRTVPRDAPEYDPKVVLTAELVKEYLRAKAKQPA